MTISPEKETRMDRMLFHQTAIPNANIFTKYKPIMLSSTNYEILLRKSSHKYMKWPFGQCIEYDVPNERTFNAMSQIECHRKCLAHKYNKNGKCLPRFVDNMMTEFDNIDNRTEICSQYFDFKDISLLSKECLLICPEECFQVEYWSTMKETELGKYRSLHERNVRHEEAVERRIVWSSSEPMFAYIDEPVLTFTAYLVYCGGLMGLWFGQSLKDLLSLFIVKLSNRYQMHFY